MLLIICCFFQSLFQQPVRATADTDVGFEERVKPKVERLVSTMEELCKQSEESDLGFLKQIARFFNPATTEQASYDFLVDLLGEEGAASLKQLDTEDFASYHDQLVQKAYTHLREKFPDEKIDEAISKVQQAAKKLESGF